MNSRTSLRTVIRTLVFASLCGLAWIGCSRSEQSEADKGPSADGTGAAQRSAAPAVGSPSRAERVFTATPRGWSPIPVDGIRRVAFRVERDSHRVDITLTDLAASAGTLLPNVNRWRQQIQLEEISEEKLSESTEAWEMAGVVGHYVELIGPESERPRQAILAVVAIRESRAWFAKLWGDADLAREERERFREFVQSVRFAPADSSGRPERSWATGSAQVQVADPLPEESIRYVVPEGWWEAPGSGLRRATFQIQEGALAAEATAIGLPGSATRLLDNVNLWRRQIGLADTTQEELNAVLEPIEIGGRPGHYIRLAGAVDAERSLGMLVVLAGDQDRTWLFKMVGDSALVSREQEHFEAFVRSVRFVPAGGETHD